MNMNIWFLFLFLLILKTVFNSFLIQFSLSFLRRIRVYGSFESVGMHIHIKLPVNQSIDGKVCIANTTRKPSLNAQIRDKLYWALSLTIIIRYFSHSLIFFQCKRITQIVNRLIRTNYAKKKQPYKMENLLLDNCSILFPVLLFLCRKRVTLCSHIVVVMQLCDAEVFFFNLLFNEYFDLRWLTDTVFTFYSVTNCQLESISLDWIWFRTLFLSLSYA